MMIKKILTFVLIAILISCDGNNNDENQQFESKNRIKSLVDASSYGLKFFYNGDINNCLSIKTMTDDYHINYAYENNILVQSFRDNYVFEYSNENGKISEMRALISNFMIEKFKYFYNADDQLIKIEYYADQGGTLEFQSYTVLMYDANGNNYRSDLYDVNSSLVAYEINTFDNKNNIFKNFEPKIALMEYNPFGSNITSKIRNFTNPELLDAVTTYEYEYNSNGFPIKSTIKYPLNDNIVVTEYSYE